MTRHAGQGPIRWSVPARAGVEPAGPARAHHGRHSVVDVQAAEDLLDVVVDRVLRGAELGCDLTGGAAIRQQAQDATLVDRHFSLGARLNARDRKAVRRTVS